MKIIEKTKFDGKFPLKGSVLLVDKVFTYGEFTYGDGVLVNGLGRVVNLTPLETAFIDYLFSMRGKGFVSIEEIEENVWVDKVSVFSIRNYIKKIRDKTCRDFILMKSNIGYMIPEEK